MKRAILLSSVCAGALLVSTGSASAQAPGRMPSTQAPAQQTPPGQQVPDSTMAQQNPGQNTATKVNDKKFLSEAAEGGLAEVELGKLAVQKSSDDKVKQFAQKMVDDHTNANEQLKQVASQDGVAVPDTLDSKHQSRIDKLSKLSGTQFDKAYLKDQQKDHQTDVREFTEEAQNGTDPKVKAFASSTLPTLQQHLQMVKSLNKTEK